MSKKSKLFVILGAGVLVVAGVAAPAILRGQPPGMNAANRELVVQFDADENGWLNNEERKKARTYHLENPAAAGGFGLFGFGGPGGGPPGGGPGGGPPGGGPEGGNPLLDLFGLGGPPNGGPGGAGGRGGPGGRGPGGRGPGGRGGANRPKASEGVKIEKSSVAPLKNELYDTNVLRTIFIDFENEDWEKEMEDFDGTDVDVPAKLTVDGKEYPNCGIHFRGMSSYFMVPAGYKRSLNISMNMADKKQRLLGFKTLNLLNGSSDDSMMSTVLYSKIARQHMPAPRANFVRVVINGEYWGVYTNVEQFNKDFVKANYGSGKGARWKVSGSPRGGGGLDYRGDDPSRYQSPYEQKSGDEKDLAKLIELCRVLDETPAEELPAKLEPLVDVDELLWFIALDNGLNNSDGYWVRASDYSIYLDKDDKFHFIPHDMNEAFRAAGGPGGGPGGPRGRGRGGRRGGAAPTREAEQGAEASSPVDLDPLIGMDDSSKPLRSKVLAVPKYRAQYLQNMRELAQTSLDWKKMGPFVEKQAALIDKAVKDETRKLGTYEAFVAATSAKADDENAHSAAAGGHGAMNLKEFADARRKYLLKKAAK